jgi:beta-lactamase superfamily II metal-dependent hydrolase
VKLTLFPADKGDCFLVTGAKGQQLLVDGGMRQSYKGYVASALAQVKRLDVVCVSHIDQDHISGILQMMDDLVAWRVHDYQIESGNRVHRRPSVPKPPEIGQIWHNAFHEQIGKNAEPIERILAATSVVLSGGETRKTEVLAQSQRDLVTSVGEGIQLSRRVGEGQLNIPRNPPADGGLIYVQDDPVTVRLRGMKVTVIGPFEEDLRNLRDEWNGWLRKNREALTDIQRLAREDEDHLPKTEVQRMIGTTLEQARILGDRGRVTIPNLASLMLLVEEADQTALLTGDGHGKDILKGLGHTGKLNGTGRMHVNILKIQHHGSEHNIDVDFCRAITADHYIFCADGAHHNPDLAVVDAVINSRRGTAAERSRNPQVDVPFTLWFNSSSSISKAEDARAHMRKVEELVRRRRSRGMKIMFRHREETVGLEVSI